MRSGSGAIVDGSGSISRTWTGRLGRYADRIDRLERLLVRVLAKAELKPPLRRDIERALERLHAPINWDRL